VAEMPCSGVHELCSGVHEFAFGAPRI
jgi:hypothetical protein